MHSAASAPETDLPGRRYTTMRCCDGDSSANRCLGNETREICSSTDRIPKLQAERRHSVLGVRPRHAELVAVGRSIDLERQYFGERQS